MKKYLQFFPSFAFPELAQLRDQTDTFWKFYSSTDTFWLPKTVEPVLGYTIEQVKLFKLATELFEDIKLCYEFDRSFNFWSEVYEYK